ncbi:hypothetical protein AcetOrient_orf02603 [Acetobacter orientalis]|uniref:Uncharacterized protein n=1 Tax=Acetobacter orientalis TaxID=146474 RepID=A0A2Z5ZJ03_9PROT|nr:hypothetical protein AcetOrient_orf02603 [Acetobacter orientalis]
MKLYGFYQAARYVFDIMPLLDKVPQASTCVLNVKITDRIIKK